MDLGSGVTYKSDFGGVLEFAENSSGFARISVSHVDLRSVNNTILGDIDSLQSNWTNSLLGETATINLYRRQYGFAEATDNNLPPELADIYQGKTDKDLAGSITLN